jgi:hypothetical protein
MPAQRLVGVPTVYPATYLYVRTCIPVDQLDDPPHMALYQCMCSCIARLVTASILELIVSVAHGMMSLYLFSYDNSNTEHVDQENIVMIY